MDPLLRCALLELGPGGQNPRSFTSPTMFKIGREADLQINLHESPRITDGYSSTDQTSRR